MPEIAAMLVEEIKVGFLECHQRLDNIGFRLDPRIKHLVQGLYPAHDHCEIKVFLAFVIEIDGAFAQLCRHSNFVHRGSLKAFVEKELLSCIDYLFLAMFFFSSLAFLNSHF